MLKGVSLSKRFGGVFALRETSLEIPRGKITGIVGPNGAGKTTLFNVLSGLHTPDSGKIFLNGEDVTRLPMFERARRGMTRTFQISRELGELTLIENLLLAAPQQSGESILANFLRTGRVAQEEAQILALAGSQLERIGLTRLADEPARTLSGGQKKLLELARALMTQPKILLLDEPAAGVNPSLVNEVTAFISSLRQDGMTVAIIEHNMDVVAAICDPVYVMAEGSVLTHGKFVDVTADQRVIDAYLGGVI
jgi:ABC-type branched-subunit amino acid transport system ATPase component